MPDYVLNRTHTHRSTHGHIINFFKGQPVYVPPVCEREVVVFGAEPVDGEKIDVLDDQTPAYTEEPGGAEREAQILAAFSLLEERNQRGDFTGQGRPHPVAIKELTGIKVDARERDMLWERHIEARNA